MLETLKLRVDKLIEENKDKKEELEKFILIKEILNKENCFINMNIEYAYAILRDLGVPEEKLKEVYLKLI